MTWCCALWQAVVLEAGEERDAAQQQAADAEELLIQTRQEAAASAAAVREKDSQLRQVMEAQQRLAQQLEAVETESSVRGWKDTRRRLQLLLL